MYARLHGKHHNLLDNETYLEIFDEISNVSGFKIDKIGYLLLHPDYELRDIGKYVKCRNKKYRDIFRTIHIPREVLPKGENSGGVSPCIVAYTFDRGRKGRREDSDKLLLDFSLDYMSATEDRGCSFIKFYFRLSDKHSVSFKEYVKFILFLQEKGIIIDWSFCHLCVRKKAFSSLNSSFHRNWYIKAYYKDIVPSWRSPVWDGSSYLFNAIRKQDNKEILDAIKSNCQDYEEKEELILYSLASPQNIFEKCLYLYYCLPKIIRIRRSFEKCVR